jgi:hypothetical protein
MAITIAVAATIASTIAIPVALPAATISPFRATILPPVRLPTRIVPVVLLLSRAGRRIFVPTEFVIPLASRNIDTSGDGEDILSVRNELFLRLPRIPILDFARDFGQLMLGTQLGVHEIELLRV